MTFRLLDELLSMRLLSPTNKLLSSDHTANELWMNYSDDSLCK